MKILTSPERMVLSVLYNGGKINFDKIVETTQIAIIDCFNILQRLIIKNLINYSQGNYYLDQENITEVKNLLQLKRQIHLEAGQIINSTLEANDEKIKMKEIQCTSYDLKILRHYFTEVEHYIQKISQRKADGVKKHYIFWGEQSCENYLAQIKKTYHRL